MSREIPSVAITRPTPAYDILTWVQKHISEEPKRIRMGKWCLFRADVLTELRDEYDRTYNFPRCGTVACEAGWIALRSGIEVAGRVPVIEGQIEVAGRVPVIEGQVVSWEDMAVVIAGFNEEARTELQQSFLSGAHFDTPDGTREQAEATAKFLEDFKRKWRRELKARIILPGGMVQAQ